MRGIYPFLREKNIQRLLPLFVILIALPLLVVVSQKQQELRQQAAVTLSCNNGLTCTACTGALSNTCSYGNGKQSCTYTTHISKQPCNAVTVSSVFCYLNNCSSGSTCNSSKQCVGGTNPTPTPTKAVTPTPNTPNNSACSSAVSPGESLSSAFKAVGSGQTLCVHGGTYTEKVSATVASGAKIIAYPGERPVISGLMWLTGLNNVTIDGINVTWNSSNGSGDHMVKFSGGSGWTYQNSEVWGAHSYAGILVSNGASNFKMTNLYVHDTFKSNDTNQDHLIYINEANNGVVERSLFVNSVNGRGIKLGPPSGGSAGPGGIVIRYNTFYNNTGPSNIQLSYGAHNNEVYRNILQKSSQENITAYNLNGSGNKVHDNIGWEGDAVASSSFDTGGNLKINPQFTNLSNNFHPLNPQAQAYGKYAN